MADLALDVLAQLLVALHPFTAGRGELHEHGVVAFDAALGEQLGKRLEPHIDALGVVQPVDAEHDLAGVADLGADLLGPSRMLRSRAFWSSSAESIEMGNAPTRTVRSSSSTSTES